MTERDRMSVGSDIMPPDIACYADGNTGTPYVHAITGPDSGPTAMISAIVHGNELCGAVALDRFLKSGIEPRRGRLILAFCNVEAYRRFDLAHPYQSRFVDEDFNRLWSPEKLDDLSIDTVERRRARQLRPFLEEADLLLDLHSMQSSAQALALSGTLPRGRDLAKAVGYPAIVVSDAGHAAGMRMRDYGAFNDPESSKASLLVECGQHRDPASADVANEVLYRFLHATGFLDATDLPAAYADAPIDDQTFVEITDIVTVATDAFRFIEPLKTHDIIPDAGTVIAVDGGRAIATAYDDCIAIMPTAYPSPGATAVRLGKKIPSP